MEESAGETEKYSKAGVPCLELTESYKMAGTCRANRVLIMNRFELFFYNGKSLEKSMRMKIQFPDGLVNDKARNRRAFGGLVELGRTHRLYIRFVELKKVRNEIYNIEDTHQFASGDMIDALRIFQRRTDACAGKIFGQRGSAVLVVDGTDGLFVFQGTLGPK